MQLTREIVSALPPDINAVFAAVNAPPAPFVPQQHHLSPGYALLLTGFGSATEHADSSPRSGAGSRPCSIWKPPCSTSSCRSCSTRPTAGAHAYDKSAYLEDLSDPVIDVVTEHVPGKHSPMSALMLYRLDGAYSQVGEDETAFSGGRSPRYAAFIIGLAPDAAAGHGAPLGPRLLGGTEYAGHRRRGRLYQRQHRILPRRGLQKLRPGQVRTAGPDQGRLRPGQHVPHQREHRSGRANRTREPPGEPPSRGAASFLPVPPAFIGSARG